jgi:hypothetical protein
MRCQNLLHSIVVILLTITLYGLLGCGDTKDPMPVTPSENEAAEGAAILSGRVIDVEQRPVAGLALVIQPFEIDESTGVHTYASALMAKTDDTGHFSIRDIYHDEFQFLLASDDQSHVPFDTEYEIISIKIGDFAYHPNESFPTPFNRNTFSITPGGHAENVEVTVRFRMRIRAKIVFKDGTPLANKEFDINIRALDLHSGNVVGGIQGSGQTDSQGYFVQYVDENRATGYRVSVEYNGLCATSEDFVLRVGERRENLILKLT